MNYIIIYILYNAYVNSFFKLLFTIINIIDHYI